ncbi:hypothetical protein B0H21DRAFT_826181 [Amylocystis lapponica]|nr:hypothetical protein B0H21DRAFT_826181 [Amylocystis lapponica]
MSKVSQPVLSSFDPLATHPFTNNSGLLPMPTPPSSFPHPISSAYNTSSIDPKQSTYMYAPQPKHASPSQKSKANAGGPRPIFVPFRPERSSPELDDILLKKRVSDVLTNKQSWSIDQSTVPIRSAVPSAQGGQAR